MNRLRSWSLVTLLFLQAASVGAVDKGCYTLLAPYISPGDASLKGLDLEVYRNAKNLLFLSDGLNSRNWISLGKRVSEAFPEKNVVSADFNYNGPSQVGNRKLVSMNNIKTFPFESDSFDLVVLRRGLCVCSGSRCCGGFAPLREETKSFFKETVRVMNKRNPQARVILHGAHGVTSNVTRKWTEFLSEIEREMNVKATLYFDREDDAFMMIGIRPR